MTAKCSCLRPPQLVRGETSCGKRSQDAFTCLLYLHPSFCLCLSCSLSLPFLHLWHLTAFNFGKFALNYVILPCQNWKLRILYSYIRETSYIRSVSVVIQFPIHFLGNLVCAPCGHKRGTTLQHLDFMQLASIERSIKGALKQQTEGTQETPTVSVMKAEKAV